MLLSCVHTGRPKARYATGMYKKSDETTMVVTMFVCMNFTAAEIHSVHQSTPQSGVHSLMYVFTISTCLKCLANPQCKPSADTCISDESAQWQHH